MAFQTIFDAGFRKGMPHLTSWFERCMSNASFIKHIGHIKMTEKAMKSWDPATKPTQAAPAKAASAKEEKPTNDNDLNLFGDDNQDDNQDDIAAAKAVVDANKAKANAKPKKEVIAQSLVLFEVKPLDDTTNLDDMAAKILAI